MKTDTERYHESMGRTFYIYFIEGRTKDARAFMKSLPEDVRPLCVALAMVKAQKTNTGSQFLGFLQRLAVGR